MIHADAAAILECGKPLSGKWKLDILYLLSGGPARWSQLVHSFPDAAPNVLTRQLRQLEQDGLIFRRVSSPKPPQTVEYRLTEQGAAAVPFLKSLCAWDRKFRKDAAG